MTPHRPDSGGDNLRPPDLPYPLETLLKTNDGMSKDVFQIACLAGDTAAASIAAWHFVQTSEADTRDAVLEFVIESIGFADVGLVDRIRRIWGTVRPQGPWAPALEWPDIVETIQILTTAPTGTVATDLLAYSIYPFERPSRIKAMWDSTLEVRAQTLADTTKPLVTRLAAALAMTEGIDPRWSHCEEAEGGATTLLCSTLSALAIPGPADRGDRIRHPRRVQLPCPRPCSDLRRTGCGREGAPAGHPRPELPEAEREHPDGMGGTD